MKMNMGLLTEHDMNAAAGGSDHHHQHHHSETTEVLLTLLSQNKALEGKG